MWKEEKVKEENGWRQLNVLPMRSRSSPGRSASGGRPTAKWRIKQVDTRRLTDSQIRLKERISRIYRNIAQQFSFRLDKDSEWTQFWMELAMVEKAQASLLSLENQFFEPDGREINTELIDKKTHMEIDLILSSAEKKIVPGMTEQEAIAILVSIESALIGKNFSSFLHTQDMDVSTYITASTQVYDEHARRIIAGIRKYGNLTFNQKNGK